MDPPRPIGVSRHHLDLLERIEKVAPTDVEVLLSGPTGSGKEVYAQHLHGHSPRSGHSFVAVNCGAVPSELFENEMFGHIGGAYTDAHAPSHGLAVEAEGGTLFLDEVDSLSLPNQVKLLRFVQSQEYRRLGDPRIRRANVRFVSATNADLRKGVRDGWFREDLFYRLRVVPLEVPPLSARRDDIRPLLDEFASQFSRQYRLPRIVLSPEAAEALQAYDWPGNVRELESCVKFLTCLQLARAVDRFDLPFTADAEPQPETPPTPALAHLPFTAARSAMVADFERRYLSEALRRANGNVSRAARECGEYRKKIARLMKKHGIEAGGD